MSERLWHLLSGKLDEIAALYKVRPRITLIVRVPGKPKECVFLSDDSWADAVATVRDLHGDPTAFAAGPPEPAPEAAKVRICACAWCGAALVRNPDAPHCWRCINAEQRKCVARGDWYILDDDRDYVPAYPPPAPPQAREVEEAAEEALVAWRTAWLAGCAETPAGIATAAIGLKTALEALLAALARGGA